MNHSRYLYYTTLIQQFLQTVDWLAGHSSRKRLRQFLADMCQEIGGKRNEIQSKQGQGVWPLSSRDRVFIKYLDATESIVSSTLKRLWLTRGVLQNMKNQLRALTNSLERDHNPKMKVVFLAQEANIWPSFESVYRAFSEDPRCEAQIVYLPFEHANNDKSMDWFDIYQKMGLPVRDCREYDLSAESPDLAFFAKPYDGIPPEFLIDNVGRVVERCVYIPYWVNWMAFQNIPFLIQYHYQLPFFEKAWKIFDAPNYVQKSHVAYAPKRGANLELVGHPRFDALKRLDVIRESISPSWQEKIANKKVVMWNTHSNIASGKNENWSTFHLLGQRILDYFRASRQFTLVWRPHPHFFNSLINGGVMTAEEVERLIAEVSNSNSIILDATPNYLAAFSVADALISDASSLLVEFIPTRKPILYTYPDETYSIVNENVLPALYTARSWEEVQRFLQGLLGGQDDKLSERVHVIETFMPNAGKNVGKLVMEKCLEDLIAEETGAGKALAEQYRQDIAPNF